MAKRKPVPRNEHGMSAKCAAAMEKMVKRFQTGDLSPFVHVARIERDPDDNCPMAHWSFRNQVMAWAQTESMDCRTYKQWQEFGRQVPKGATSAWVMRPQPVYKTKSGQVVLDENGKPVVSYMRFFWFAVFPAECTEGETPLPERNYAPKDLPPLTDVAEKFGIKYTWTPLPPDRRGEATVDGCKLFVGTEDPKTWFHELAHCIHAKLEGGLKGGQDTTQETVAEFVAAVLMEMYGFGDRSGNTWGYIRMYAKDPYKAVERSMSTIEQVLEAMGV